MEDTYKTIQSEAQGLFKDKGSRFISFAFPVVEESQVRNYVNVLRKKYHDARHVCYAFRIGHHEYRDRANDDGEPSGTAGKPILGQIVGRELTDVLVIVVRYFGGVLLGTSGLINAYRIATIDCLNNAAIVKKTIEKNFEIFFNYDQMNHVMKIIKDGHIRIIEQHFDIDCNMILKVPLSAFDKVSDRLLKINKLTINEK